MLIAQISDIHAFEGAASLVTLDHAMLWLGGLRPDAVVISGDISNKPHERGYELVKAAFAGLRFPIFMVPGNVDDRAAMRKAFPEHDYWPDEGPMNFSHEFDQGVRLIGLDVTVPGAVHGDAGPHLDWLAEQLNAGDTAPTIIMMHQNAFATGMSAFDRNMCRNAEGFARVLAEASDPVAGVICGHGHRPMFARIGQVPALMCPSLTRVNPLIIDGRGEPASVDPPGLMVHAFNADGLVSHVVSLAI
ncbi:metallophosphatase [Devosia sp. D6-9]|nr:metallophosphatase [Devosia sp. D6-9]